MSGDFSATSVLLVEDQAQSRQLIARMLTTLGVGRLKETADGDDALTVLGNTGERFDVVLCDWMMPNVDGLTVLRELKRHSPDTPFVMLTSRADAASVSEAILAGVSGYLRKPFTLAELQERLRPYARRRGT